MFLEGYRDITEKEKDEHMEMSKKVADKLGLADEEREEYLEVQKSSLEAEKVHVVPIENKVRKI